MRAADPSAILGLPGLQSLGLQERQACCRPLGPGLQSGQQRGLTPGQHRRCCPKIPSPA